MQLKASNAAIYPRKLIGVYTTGRSMTYSVLIEHASISLRLAMLLASYYRPPTISRLCASTRLFHPEMLRQAPKLAAKLNECFSPRVQLLLSK